MSDQSGALDLAGAPQAPGMEAEDNRPTFLFVSGPLHGLLMPVGEAGQTVLHTESGTKYRYARFTQNEAHPITGQPVPTWNRFVYVVETLLTAPVQSQMQALGQAVLLAWFRTGERVEGDGVAAIVDAPTPEHTVTCKDGGAACFTHTNASLAKAMRAAAEHNEATGHHLEHTTITPEPPVPDGQHTEESAP